MHEPLYVYQVSAHQQLDFSSFFESSDHVMEFRRLRHQTHHMRLYIDDIIMTICAVYTLPRDSEDCVDPKA